MNPLEAPIAAPANAIKAAARHALAWLVAANLAGCLLAALLLFPSLNGWLGEWTYGRWMPVHLNLQLYGWCSLPLVAWLLKVYQADRDPACRFTGAALWAWSAALIFGAFSWLNGHTTGKVFLDWHGLARPLVPLAAFILWLVLAWSLGFHWTSPENVDSARRWAKAFGLALLLAVPPALYWAASPGVYPPVNPDTGGPTGASLLESTLAIIAILLVLPYAIGRRPTGGYFGGLALAWWTMGICFSMALGRGNDTHHRPDQILGLGSLLPWVFLLPAYYSSFAWPAHTTRWRWACFAWWGLLLVSAWVTFLPGLLDRLKFTDALVGHSHLAMAGFISSLNVLLLVSLLDNDGAIFGSNWAFTAWQSGALGYVLLMSAAGWFEGAAPAFTIVPGFGRNAFYSLRLGCGVVMTAASWNWWIRASQAPRQTSWARSDASESSASDAVSITQRVT